MEELAAARKVVVAVGKSEYGLPFSEPVSPEEAPDYEDYILHPMDLGTLADRLKNGQYGSCGTPHIPHAPYPFTQKVGEQTRFPN